MTRILHNREMQQYTPSIFALQPWQAMSDKYGFVPTIEVIDMLRAEGFSVVKAAQSRTRIEGKAPFTRHMVRLRHQTFIQSNVGEEVPEIVLVNSHDGTSSYRFMAGVFRIVCSNGMIVQSAEFGTFRVRHIGDQDFYKQVVRISREIADEAPVIMDRIERWKGIELSQGQQEAFARAALHLRDNNTLEPRQILAARRQADNKPDLWTTTNRIQESLIRGGIPTRNASGRRFTTKPIKSVDSDVRLNQSLWILAQQMETLVA